LEHVYNQHYSLHGCLWDVALLSLLRIFVALATCAVCAYRPRRPAEPAEMYHPNGERKSKADLEAEALEEPYSTQFLRYFSRRSVGVEMLSLVTAAVVAAKAMARLNVEIGIYNEAHAQHPWFWIVLAATTGVAWLEGLLMDGVEVLLEAWGRGRQRPANDRTSSSLRQPLLSPNDIPQTTCLEDTDADTEHGQADTVDDNERGHSEITADANYTATLSDIWKLCEPDRHLILLASLFLIAGGIAQVFVPKFTGTDRRELLLQYPFNC
jgi:hypothetical protein